MSAIVTAIVVGTVATAGATVYAANKAEKTAEKQMEEAEKQRKKVEADYNEQQRRAATGEMQSAAKAKQDQARKQALASYGTSDTLLTGPSGLGSSPMIDQTKMGSTLLGG
jgi:hypothetical protein